MIKSHVTVKAAAMLAAPSFALALAYVATLQGSTVALNASTGKIIWKDDLSPFPSKPFCNDFAASGGNIGFIGTPTIDRAHNKLYIVSGRGTLHAYDLATGANTPALTVQIPDPANAPPHTFVYGSPTLTGTSALHRDGQLL